MKNRNKESLQRFYSSIEDVIIMWQWLFFVDLCLVNEENVW